MVSETTQRKAYPPPPPPPRVQASPAFDPDLVASPGVGRAVRSAGGLGPGPSSEVVQQQLEDLEGKLLLQLDELAQVPLSCAHHALLLALNGAYR